MIVTHNLGTKDVLVQVYLKSTGEMVGTGIRIVDENSVEVQVSGDESDLRVVVGNAAGSGGNGMEWTAAEW